MTDEEQIRELIERWQEATREGKLEEILPLMAEDVVFLTPGNPPMRGREAFASGFRPALAQSRIESTGEVQDISVVDDLAYSWTQLSVRIIPRGSGDAMLRTGPVLTIFRKEPSGRWVVSRDANMLSAVEEN